MAIADLMGAIAMKIHQPAPLLVDQINALTALQRRQTGSREGLVNEAFCVSCQQCRGGRINLFRLPGLPLRRQIDIAFAPICCVMRVWIHGRPDSDLLNSDATAGWLAEHQAGWISSAAVRNEQALLFRS